ncbi:phage terminase small subunit [Terasakiella pusilla]|uniref:phage terminase small subunit n=1 Tax=Terasakiella pusilla TaxID=64973 RepID=UPI003AA9BAC3
MSVIQQRRAAKLAAKKKQAEQQQAAAKKHAAQAKTETVAPAKKPSKLRQAMAAREAAKTTEQKVTDLDHKVDGLEGQVDDMDHDLTETQGKVDQLDDQVNGLDDAVDGLQDEVNELEKRVTTHDEDINELRARLDSEEGTGNPELEEAKETVAKCIEETRTIEDIADRAPVKAEAVKRLEAFVMKYIESAAAYPNIAAVWFMIWLFDLADIPRAVKVGLYLAKQGIHKMPTRFNSTIYTYICDNVYDWAKAELEAERSAGPYLQQVVEAMEAQGWEVPIVVRGKMHAMLGKHLEALTEYKAALDEYETAMSINDRAGVKKRIDAMKAKLNIKD